MTTENTDRAAALRGEAAAMRESARESFERCDTDGFLSQWADGINARLRDTQAELAENGDRGLFERTVLERLDGSRVEDAKICNTRFGTKWRSDGDDVWLAYRPERESTLARKGYRERTVEEVGPAKAKLDSPPGARGLSGATQVTIRVYRPDKPRSEGWRYVGPPPDEPKPASERGDGIIYGSGAAIRAAAAATEGLSLMEMAAAIEGRAAPAEQTIAELEQLGVASGPEVIEEEVPSEGQYVGQTFRSTYDGGPGRVHVDDKLDEMDGVPYSIPKYADADTPGLIDSREARAEARRIIVSAFGVELHEIGGPEVEEAHRIALAVFDRMAEAAENQGRM